MYTSIVTIYVGGGGGLWHFSTFVFDASFESKGFQDSRLFSYFYIRVQPLTSEFEF